MDISALLLTTYIPVGALIVFYVFFPVFVIYLCSRYNFFDKIGAVIICYIVGILIGNLGILSDITNSPLKLITEITVPLSLPLLLFSIDIKRWSRLAGKTALSLVLIIFSVIVVSFIGFAIFKDRIDQGWKVAGMLIGVYTGGTPNLVAIKNALGVSDTTYLTVHTSDVFIGAVYLLFVVTIAQRVFLKFLPPFKRTSASTRNSKTVELSETEESMAAEEISSYEGILKREKLIPLVGAFFLSVAILAVGAGFMEVVPKKFAMAAAILMITTLGIAFSFVPKIRKIDKSFQLGMYIILIFCLAVGSLADIRTLIKTAPVLFSYVGIAVFGSMFLHLALSAIFRIDADTVIITSTSAICSPPFVGMVAGALKNKEIVVSGLTTGIIGYAIGNYIGVMIAYLFHYIFPPSTYHLWEWLIFH